MDEKSKDKSYVNFLFASFLAGVIASIGSNPFWVVNGVMIKYKDENKSFFATFKKIYTTEGIPAFFKGVLASISLVCNPII